MRILNLVVMMGCVCLVGCSTLSDAVSLTAVLYEKPADKYAAQQGAIAAKHNALVESADCIQSCL